VRFEEPEEYAQKSGAPPPAVAKAPPPLAKHSLPKPSSKPPKPSKILPPLPKPTPPQQQKTPSEPPARAKPPPTQHDIPATDPKLTPPEEPPTPSMERPAIQPAEDSDADRIPVIEPSSLQSLMDEDADHGGDEDTGADVAPMGPWHDAIQAPATRLFDESNRQVVRSPELDKAGTEEEATNPRIDTSTVQAALASEQGTVTADADPLPPPITPAPTPGMDRLTPVPRDKTTVDRAEPATAEEPTPSQDTVDRDSVLSALDGAFWEPSTSDTATPDEPKPTEPVKTEEPALARAPSEDAVRIVEELVAGDSLTSAERAQLLLALGRVLVEKGIITKAELIRALDQ
jgi:hypothetical protein